MLERGLADFPSRSQHHHGGLRGWGFDSAQCTARRSTLEFQQKGVKGKRKGFERFSPNSLLWGSLLEEKRLAATCSGRVPAACPPCVRLVSGIVRLVSLESAFAPPPNLACHLSVMCPQLVRLVSALCPACVRHVSALCLPPNFVCHMSAMWPPCIRHVSALAAPPKPCQFPWHSF